MLIADDSDSLLLQCKAIIKANGYFRGKVVFSEIYLNNDTRTLHLSYSFRIFLVAIVICFKIIFDIECFFGNMTLKLKNKTANIVDLTNKKET